MEKYDHIEIQREAVVRQYKGKQFKNPPRPPERDRATYGQKLSSEMYQSVQCIESYRMNMGIQSDTLLVLEFISESMSTKLLDIITSKLEISIVEETAISDTSSKLLLQFKNKNAISIFNYERELWEKNDPSDATLTYAQRRDLFCCIEKIRNVSREDRIGPNLKNIIKDSSLIPTGFFVVNIDVWYNGDRFTVIDIESQIKKVLGTQGSALLGDLFATPSLLLGRARVNEFSLNALLDLDIVAMVELPFSAISIEPNDLFPIDIKPIIVNELDDKAPLATILDSGIFSANPLLRDVIVAEEEFDRTENTTSDMNGHGTAVAGIVVYGDFASCLNDNLFKPLVRICNGKIMHDEGGRPCFAIDKRPEQIVKEAIEYFHNEYGCRVFNLSAGNDEHIYSGGRQYAWAEMLDFLSKQLDIVIIVSAGNVSSPQINDFETREELLEKCRDQLFDKEHRIIDPATSALSITVGAITRYDEPSNQRVGINRISVGKKDYPSVFTRIGKGVNKAIKPEFVDYGGNYAIFQPIRGNNRWAMNDQKLLEPTLNNTNDKIYKGYVGTSLSAPHVTHIAARIERALENQIGEKPSANLVRAFLANSAKCTGELIEWAEKSHDKCYTGLINPKVDRRMRMLGYGKVDDSLLNSNTHQVTLFAEDKLELRSFHLYKIPVPSDFINLRGEKSIVISLAYNPITRLSRKDYLTNNLWFEVFRKIDEDTLLQYKAKKELGEDDEEDIDNMPNDMKADFNPGYRDLTKSTIQQRSWKKGARGGRDLVWNEEEPYIFVMVTGKERYRYAEQAQPQDYSLVITFSYQGEQDIQLYNKLQSKVRIKQRQRARVRTQLKI